MPGELRIPSKLLRNALSEKKLKQLRLLASAKLEGHRSEIKCLCENLRILPKTCGRLVKRLVEDGWAGSDGKFLFPRAWQKLKFNKRGGMYLVSAPVDLKKFEALCFAMALKRVYRLRGSPRSNKRVRGAMQKDFPTGYLTKALQLKERRFKTLKAQAQRYKFISVTPQYTVLGSAKHFVSLRKNLSGVPVFIRGKKTVSPEISKIRVLV